jgi:hypothetical protein
MSDIADIEDLMKNTSLDEIPSPLNTKINRSALFLELANPDENGVSRWVKVSEFVGKYYILQTNNGSTWARSSSALSKKYIIDKQVIKNKIDAYKLCGYHKIDLYRSIPANVKKHFKNARCLLTGISAEIDHKRGNYPDIDISNVDNYQPLSQSVNKAKRQHCFDCKKTNIRFDAKRIQKAISYYSEDKSLTFESANWCVGCYWYDIIEFDKQNIKYIIQNNR